MIMEIPSEIIWKGSETQMQAHVIFNLVYGLLHGKYTAFLGGQEVGK